MGQGHETINFGVRRSKVKVTQGQNRSEKSLSARISKTIQRILAKPGRHILR